MSLIDRTQKRIEFFCTLCGVVFILSGVMKAMDTGAFARLLGGYGIPYLEYISPLLAIGEMLTGMLLLFRLWQRQIAVIASAAIVVFTCGFSYGLFIRDITDCGCFGQAQFLNTSPALLYVRNAILLAMLTDIAIHSGIRRITRSHLLWAGTALVAGSCITAFMAGNTFRHIHPTATQTRPQPVAITDTPLTEFITTSADSTYLVFAFTYSCPHCLNSIANLNGYEPAGAVDKVIAIAMGNDDDEALFRSQFRPTFQIINAPDRINLLTKEFPKSFYIRHDSIMVDFNGELPCAKVFTDIIGKAF